MAADGGSHMTMGRWRFNSPDNESEVSFFLHMIVERGIQLDTSVRSQKV